MHPFMRKHGGSSSNMFRNQGNRMQLERNENGEAIDGFDSYQYTQSGPREYREKVNSPLTDKENVLLSALKDKREKVNIVLDPDKTEANNNPDPPKKKLLNCFRSTSSSIEDDLLHGFGPLDFQTGFDLTKLLIGSDRKQPLQWTNQSFIFNNNNLKTCYGLLQYKGGCCGVLAPVQAFVIKSLLFGSDNGTYEEPLRVTLNQVREALIQALTDILWQAGQSRAVLVLTKRDEIGMMKNFDEIVENLMVRPFSTKSRLKESLSEHIDYFSSPSSNGCLLIVISAILSRGIANVFNDMDDESCPIIGNNDFCSLELVNLLLTGRAVSNVFDNSLQIDSCTLTGIISRADIGFLSLYEHYNSCQVGSNLKTPRFPIWVVNCENHFTVLFSCRKELVSNWRAERQFNLYHYDGYHMASDEIKLSIDTTGIYEPSVKKNEIVPPLEHCIRTKWKGAAISWCVTDSPTKEVVK